MRIKTYIFCTTFLANLLFTACNNKKDDPGPSISSPTIKTPELPTIDNPFLGVYINNKLVSILADTHNLVFDPINDSLVLKSNTGTFSFNKYPSFTSDIHGYYNNRFHFQIARNSTDTSSLSKDAFKAFFNPGTYPYSQLTSLNGFKILLRLNHENEYYDTQNGSQEGSILTIKEATYVNTDKGELLRVVIEFNCKLYDEQGKLQKTLSHGIYRGYFRNFE
ncbi:hypothetical protein MYP_4629 [Sporocytophaga myxococcoides]|uniref:Lipoprotein n=1 Tax=Sporocytophaga myxococcoides TaxID=153721 RepID=A0A098LLN2_9BACT|nr:hypothetical protein [Sporocytophaga myxococcoides]GAL87399.1 hypothetical protein MYP_4629 [Sporocytophaga myxococcoides]